MSKKNNTKFRWDSFVEDLKLTSAGREILIDIVNRNSTSPSRATKTKNTDLTFVEGSHLFSDWMDKQNKTESAVGSAFLKVTGHHRVRDKTGSWNWLVVPAFPWVKTQQKHCIDISCRVQPKDWHLMQSLYEAIVPFWHAGSITSIATGHPMFYPLNMSVPFNSSGRVSWFLLFLENVSYESTIARNPPDVAWTRRIGWINFGRPVCPAPGIPLMYHVTKYNAKWSIMQHLPKAQPRELVSRK